MTYRVLFTFTVLLFFTACETNLTVKKYQPTDQPIQGALYYLPESVFIINAAYEIKNCPRPNNVRSDTTWKHEGLKIDVSAELTHSTKSSFNDAYIIDYTSLQSASKKYDFEVNLYDSGLIKTIKAGIKDQTAEVISSAAGAVAKIALANTAGPAGLVALGTAEVSAPAETEGLDDLSETLGDKDIIFSVPLDICKPNVRIAINNKNNVSKAVETALKTANFEKERVIELRDQIIEAGGNLSSNDNLKEALKQLEEKYKAYQVLKAQLEGINKLLVLKHSFKLYGTEKKVLHAPDGLFSQWFRDDSSFQTQVLTVNDLVQDEDFGKNIIQLSEGISKIEDDEKKAIKTFVENSSANIYSEINLKIEESVDLEFRIDGPVPLVNNISDNSGQVIVGGINSAASDSASIPAPEAVSEKEYNGIVYRQSTTAIAYLCLKKDCENDKFLQSKEFMIPDAGPLGVLPFENKAFQENGFEADFSEKGMLTRVKITSESIAAAQTELLDELAKVKLDYDQQKAKVDKATKDANKTEADALLSEQQALVKAQREEELAALTHQIDLIKKQRELDGVTVAPKVDKELVELQRLYMLEQLRSNLIGLDAKDALAELERVTSEHEIEVLLAK